MLALTHRPFRAGPVSVVMAFALFLAVRLFRYATYDPWMDEVISIDAASGSLRGVFDYAIRDVAHPPGFYLLLHGWIQLGKSLGWMRLLPVLLGALTAVPLLRLCESLKFSKSTTALLVTVVGVNAFSVIYAQEVRMYSLVMLVSTTATWQYFVFLETGRVRFLAIANALLVYSHYFGWFLVLAQCLYVVLLRRDRLRRVGVMAALVGLAFTPWTVLVVHAALTRTRMNSVLGWITRPELADVASFFSAVHGASRIQHATTLGALAFAFPVIIAFPRWVKARATRQLVLALLAFLPVGIVLVLSYVLKHSIWNDRYLILCVVPYLALAVSALEGMQRSVYSIFAVAMLGWQVVCAGTVLLPTERKYPWGRLVTRLERVPQRSQVFALEDYVFLPIRYQIDAGRVADLRVSKVRDLAEVSETQFWLAYRPKEAPYREGVNATLHARGCAIDEEIELNAVSQPVLAAWVHCSDDTAKLDHLGTDLMD